MTPEVATELARSIADALDAATQEKRGTCFLTVTWTLDRQVVESWRSDAAERGYTWEDLVWKLIDKGEIRPLDAHLSSDFAREPRQDQNERVLAATLTGSSREEVAK